MLDVVHAFCVRNGIRYSIAYGTLIGAVRHNGFIPWDDDVDIVMPRPDFEFFCNSFKNSDKYRLVYYGNDKSALAAFARVCECQSTTFEAERPWTNQNIGVWIDIFPLDGVPKNGYSVRYFFLKRLCKVVYKFRRQNHHIKDSDSFMSKLKTVLAKVIGLNGWVPHALLVCMVSLMKSNPYEKQSFWGQMACLDDGPLVFPKSLFSNVVPLSFEGRDFFAMTGYDSFLSRLYGDYMQLPSENERLPKQYWIKFKWKNN